MDLNFCELWNKMHSNSPKLDSIKIMMFLDEKYSGRAYHNQKHIQSGLGEITEIRPLLQNPNEFELAWYFHDAEYNILASDNEKKSADLSITLMRASEIAETKIEIVSRLIQVTDHKTPPASLDEKFIIDIDLAILGKSPEVYSEYVQGIRKEYSFYVDEQFRQGRSKFLECFIARPRIYQTNHYYNLYEQKARANLTSELASYS